MVKIKQTCTENWMKMKSESKSSKFCESCEKRVQDFRNTNSYNSTAECGLFNLKQVEQVHHQLSFNNIGLYAVSLLSILGIEGLNTEVFAQTQKIEPISIGQKQSVEGIRIKGLVKDKHSQSPLPLVTVIIMNNGKPFKSTRTDFEGKFELGIDTNQFSVHGIEIHFSYSGYNGDTIRTSNIASNILGQEVIVDLESIISNHELFEEEIDIMGKIEVLPKDN